MYKCVFIYTYALFIIYCKQTFIVDAINHD